MPGQRARSTLTTSRTAAPIGEVIVGAPYHRELHATFIGRAAHSGIAPEEGRSAIVACARAIVDFRLGRIDEETTANVGVVRGGVARNIVPGLCELEAEIRSQNEKTQLELIEEMLETITFAAEQSECRAETKLIEIYRGYKFKPGDLPVVLARKALESCGFEPKLALTGGGADANIFNAGGLSCVNLTRPYKEIFSYQIVYDPPEAKGLPFNKVVVRVAAFSVAPSFDKQKIVYSTGANQLSIYEYHSWVTDPGEMLSDLLVLDLDLNALVDLVTANLVGRIDDFARLVVDQLLAQAVAGLLVDLPEGDFLA